jgi:hypothetical protein
VQRREPFFFGGGRLCAVRPQMQFSAEGASGGGCPVWVANKRKFIRPHFRCKSVGTVDLSVGSAQVHFGAALNEHPYPVPRVRNEADSIVILGIRRPDGSLAARAQGQDYASGASSAV